MADYDVIADVSSTLVDLLGAGVSATGLVPAPEVLLHNLVDDVPADRLALALFLFEVLEDPSARNQARRVVHDEPPRRQSPPLALLLRYLIAPFAGGETPRLSEQMILGAALRTLYDGAIIHGNALRGGLQGTDTSLKVNLTPISLEDRTRIWQAVQRPYRLSATLEVRVVYIDSQQSRRVFPVVERDLEAEGPE